MNIVLSFLALGAIGMIGMGGALVLGSMRQVENWGFVAISGSVGAAILYTIMM